MPVPNALITAPSGLAVTNASGVSVSAATEYSYTLTSTDGTKFGTTAAATSVSPVQYAFFDQNGNFINTSSVPGTAANPLTATNVHSANALPSSATGDQLNVYQWGATAGGINAAQNVAPSGPIGIDFSLVTANASVAQGVSTYQDGFAPGTLDNMTVGQDGTITGSYSNGQSVTLARVAVASFQNEQGLVRMGGSDYEATVSSGQAQVGIASIGRFGSITGNALELSNVSISDEFTKLITAQNAFTANSKSITTANEDDQTVVNLIH
jgi:flagellar hook protein FlgE